MPARHIGDVMSLPKATVVIPCYNHGQFVGQAAKSALAQTNADVRIIIVNDGSDDRNTPGQCDQCKDLAPDQITIIHQSNQGLPAARNRGAAQTDAQFLVFLDADDWIEPQFVSRLAAAIYSAPDPDQVSHAYCQERLVELGENVWRVPEWDPLLMMVTNIHPVTTLVRRDRFEAVGGFDETLTRGYEDWDLWLKFVERGWRGTRVPEILFTWRRHSHSTMVMQVIDDHESLFKAIMDRHEDLYNKHASQLLLKMNTMMRRFDVNWIDETGYPIPLQYLWSQRDELARIREQNVAPADLNAVHKEYERLTSVRIHRWLNRSVDALPRPAARMLHAAMGFIKRFVPGPQ